MDIYEFAKMLDGRQYGEEISLEEEEKAKELGFVVVFGYSDDNMEFRGAINDELGCFDGGEVYITNYGIFEACECDCKHSIKAKESAKLIKSIWNIEGYSWIYETDIPHAIFDILKGDEKYCRGIVFDIKQLVYKSDIQHKCN